MRNEPSIFRRFGPLWPIWSQNHRRVRRSLYPLRNSIFPHRTPARWIPNRALVVGNRGVGKSVWSGVLADEVTRTAVASSYPMLDLSCLLFVSAFTKLPAG